MVKKENIGKAEIEERKPRLDWSKWDVIFFVILTPFIIFAMFVIIAPTGGISYLSGRFNYSLEFFVFILFYPTVMIILLVPFVVTSVSFVVIGSARTFISWNIYTRKKRVIRTSQIGVSVLLIIIYFFALFIPIQLYSPGYKPFTYGFREQMRSKADIEAIRDWLKRRGKEEPAGDTVRFISYGWPKSVKVLKPRYVNLDFDENGNAKVRLTWGGGFGHWGIEIGMEDMKIPASDFSQFGEYRLPLEPGAYVWHELQ